MGLKKTAKEEKKKVNSACIFEREAITEVQNTFEENTLQYSMHLCINISANDVFYSFLGT